MTAFHVIHILVGAWLALAPYLGFLETESALVMNNLIVGAVVALQSLLLGRQGQRRCEMTQAARGHSDSRARGIDTCGPCHCSAV